MQKQIYKQILQIYDRFIVTETFHCKFLYTKSIDDFIGTIVIALNIYSTSKSTIKFYEAFD